MKSQWMRVITRLSLALCLYALTLSEGAFADGGNPGHPIPPTGPKIIKRAPISIEHLNLDYGDKAGQGSVERMSYSVQHFSFLHERLSSKIEMTGSTLTLSDGVTRFSIQKLLDFINRVDTIHTEDLSFFSQDSQFHGFVKKAALEAELKHTLLDEFQFECGDPDHDVNFGDDTLQFIIEVCLSKGTARFAHMTFPESDHVLRAIIEDTIAGAFLGMGLKLESVDQFGLAIANHDFKANAHVKAGVGFEMTGAGHVEFDANRAQYRVELKEAKAGIFSIRNAVYKAIKKRGNSRITVEEPYIYLNYKPSTSAE